MDGSVRLESVGGHLVRVPVEVGASVATGFVLDTGIGLDLVSKSLLDRAGGRLIGETHVGRRMSGQRIDVPLARVPSLSLGSLRRDDALVGVFDFELPPELAGIEGFLAPTFFGTIPFTLHRQSGSLSWGTGGFAAPFVRSVGDARLNVRWDGPSVSLFVDLTLPDRTVATVEVDTGSGTLILDARFMSSLGVRDGAPGVRKDEGKDETGHAYVRFRSQVAGRFCLRDVPEVRQQDPAVMFQKIVYDGLLGDEFLRAFDVTFDLGHSRVRFASPRS
jgi:hypothetical protein